MLNLRIEFLPK